METPTTSLESVNLAAKLTVPLAILPQILPTESAALRSQMGGLGAHLFSLGADIAKAQAEVYGVAFEAK